jgi:Xaa-Pro dipeptidase
VAGESSAEAGGSDSPVVGRGPNAYVGKGASDRRLKRGEPILVDIVGACEGYAADQTRTYSLGQLADGRLREAHACARRILRDLEATAVPGSDCSALYQRTVETASAVQGVEYASAARVSFVGHGIGLEIDEPPFVSKGSRDALEVGMVFAVEPKFFVHGVGAVGVENSYSVSEDGLELLTTAPEDLVEL